MSNKIEKKISPKGIIFDMDGVLVDSEPVINAAAIAGLKEFGVDAVPDDFIPFVGAGEDMYIGGVARKYGVEYRLIMKDRVYALYLDMVEDSLEVYEDTLPVIKKLMDSNYILAVASSADRIKVDANLSTAGISQSSFKVVISGEDVEHKKPSPDIYLLTAYKIGLAPSDCLVIEDAINGIEAAHKAGMEAVGLTTSFTKKEMQEAGADYICEDIGGLIDIIKTV